MSPINGGANDWYLLINKEGIKSLNGIFNKVCHVLMHYLAVFFLHRQND